MKLPIRFPDHTEVIAQDAARFQALSPVEQVQELGEMFEVYKFLEDTSAKREALVRLALEEEERGREAIKEFVSRHG
jgi:hypothetical protein